MPGDKDEPVDWPIAPRLIDLSPVEYRVLKLICSGYSLAKEIVRGYSSKFNETISLQAIERTLAKLRNKRLVNGKHSGRALAYEGTQLGRILTC
jgi:predicted transcriptional regulator